MTKFDVEFERAWLDTINSDGTAIVACSYYVDKADGTKVIVYKNNMNEDGSLSNNWDFDINVEIKDNGFIPLDNPDLPYEKQEFIRAAILNGEDDDEFNTLEAYLILRDVFDWSNCQDVVDCFTEEFLENFCEKGLTMIKKSRIIK